MRFSAGTVTSSKIAHFHAKLIEVATAFKAGDRVSFDDDQRNSSTSALGIGLRDDDNEIGVLTISDECFLTIDDVAVSVTSCRRADAAKVGAGARLRHGDRPDQIARDHSGQPTLTLFFSPELLDVGGADRIVQGDAPAFCAYQAQPPDQDRFVTKVAARAAIIGRNRNPEQAGFRGLVPSGAFDDAVLPPAAETLRRHALCQKAADRIFEHTKFVVHPR
jgi:hypothetical protein